MHDVLWAVLMVLRLVAPFSGVVECARPLVGLGFESTPACAAVVVRVTSTPVVAGVGLRVVGVVEGEPGSLVMDSLLVFPC